MRKQKSTYIVLAIALLVSILLAAAARSNQPLFLDRVIADTAAAVFPESSYPFFKMVAELGDIAGVGIVVLLMLVWLWIKKRNYAGMAVLVLAVALGNEASKWIKELVGRERPVLTSMEMAESLSFPSGHAMVGFILYMLAAHLLAENVKSAGIKVGIGLSAFIIVLLIGLSRIVLRAHFPTDVLEGFTIGVVWTILWILLYEWLQEHFVKKSMANSSRSIHF